MSATDISLSDLSNIVKMYYPLGVNPSEKEYSSHIGFQKMKSISINKLSNESITPWNTLIKELGLLGYSDIRLMSLLLNPAYSSEILISNQIIDSILIRKTIHIHISLVGNYYTIIGRSMVIENYKGENPIKYYPALFVSPEDVFSDHFYSISKVIRKHFPTYLFVPFAFLERRVQDLQIATYSQLGAPYFTALFGGGFNIVNPIIYGNKVFGKELNS